ncbi:MAG: hypothetical protein M3R01_13260, partial [Actinomycetota bacterium]|nr:hypothetical protein [Actinomycetota bacterium]
MGAARYRAWSELRRRWRATAVLVVLVGLAGGVVLTTVAGARRTSSAYERFRQETRAGDIDVTTSDPDPARFEEMARLPQVEVLGRTAFPFIRPRGSDLFPYLEFLVVTGPDGELGRSIDRPRVLRGRMPDPDRPDELAVINRFADEAGLAVGDRMSFESYGPDQFEALFGGESSVEPAGPVVDLTVTGVVALPDFLVENLVGFEPRAILSAAFQREYGDRIGVYEGGVRARLRRGADDAPAFVDGVRRIYRDDPELELQLATERTARIDDTFRVLEIALQLCAACAGVAGLAAVGQA